MKIGDRSIT